MSAEEFGPIVSAAWLAAHLDDPDLVVVDVRWSLDAGPKRADFERGHIASAVFADLDVDLSSPASTDTGRHPLPVAASFADAMSRLGIGDNTKVVAYDDAGGLIASRLWWMLDALGRPAAVLDGGFAAWEGPTADGPASPAPAVLSPVEWPANRVITKQALAESLDGALTILDARAPDRFANGSAVDPRPGHVPGARNAPTDANFADGHFRSDAELAEQYGALGADGDNVVVYCGSGVTACADLLARRKAGLPDARLYVGSWSQWGAGNTLLAETAPPTPPSQRSTLG
jgi:thiosulfate/3-mercaptopyruvate sulfurtransferase